MTETPQPDPSPPPPRKRRERYPGRNPRKFEHKYKEQNPDAHPETLAKVIASGKTPAGTHRPIMVAEILEILNPQPGQLAVDCTLGFGGHTQEILTRILPGGRLIGIDADPIELDRTARRLRSLGYPEEAFVPVRSNYAALPVLLAERALRADLLLADLGVSSMQLDNPQRGFSTKFHGPLDMRMNPQKGEPASALLQRLTAPVLETLLRDNADEPSAARLAAHLAGKLFPSTTDLRSAIEASLPRLRAEELNMTVRRVFQALRIAVNHELASLEALLRAAPDCLSPGGCIAILTFHSGEDRRVKTSFEQGARKGVYSEISRDVTRPSPEEQRANPRSASAKLRWARRSK
jgi:16S rRNA (cytosine1402-N4)-methyltransferase